MSRSSEIKNKEILENKPYLTKKELALLLAKQGKNLDKKISQLLKKGYLISLKKGLYTTKIYSLINKDNLPEYLANVLYYPSYLSLEYILQKTGFMPEAVFVYTSVTSKLPRVFKNKMGTFSYRHVKNSLFTGFYQKTFVQNYKVKIASPAKALFDFLYLKPFKEKNYQDTIIDLRFNWSVFTREDYREFLSYATVSQSKKMFRVAGVLKELYVNK